MFAFISAKDLKNVFAKSCKYRNKRNHLVYISELNPWLRLNNAL